MTEIIYILNATLLILHEIESAYEKEWEILKLPGKVTGFLILHIPIIFIFFLGLYLLIIYPQTRGVIATLFGIAGLIPFFVHKVIVNKKEHFNKIISNILIYGNILIGMILLIIGITDIVNK